MPERTSHRPVRATPRKRGLDPYEVLQVSPQASDEVIKAAYRVLARSFHPDVNPDSESARQMYELNAAYEALNDPVRRAAIDERARVSRRARLTSRPPSKERLVRVVPADDAPRRGRGTATAPFAVPARGRSTGPGRGALLATVTVVLALVLALVVAFWILSVAMDDGPASAGLFTAAVEA